MVEAEAIALTYRLACPATALAVSTPAAPVHTDGLWQTTCLELFVRTGPEAYAEYNFSPSGAWAAYRFSGYREGMAPMKLDHVPQIEAHVAEDALVVRARIPLPPVLPAMASLSAVIEEKDGTKSYWALAHPAGKPDFHDGACFVLELPAAVQP